MNARGRLCELSETRPRVNISVRIIILLLQFIVISVVKLYLISQWCIATPGFTVVII